MLKAASRARSRNEQRADVSPTRAAPGSKRPSPLTTATASAAKRITRRSRSTTPAVRSAFNFIDWWAKNYITRRHRRPRRRRRRRECARARTAPRAHSRLAARARSRHHQVWRIFRFCGNFKIIPISRHDTHDARALLVGRAVDEQRHDDDVSDNAAHEESARTETSPPTRR